MNHRSPGLPGAGHGARAAAGTLAVFLLVLGVSCSGGPEPLPGESRAGLLDRAAADRAARASLEKSGDEASTSLLTPLIPPGEEHALSFEKVYYNLSPVTSRSGASAPAVAAPEVVPPPPALEEIPAPDLVEELKRRWTEECRSLPDGIGGKLPEAALLEREAVLRRLLALSFLTAEDADAGDECLPGAIEHAALEDASTDHILLAAAYLERAGKSSEALALAARFASPASAMAAPGEEPEEVQVSPNPFEIVHLTFAERIDGPGKYTPAKPSDIIPGRDVLLYGEFKNFGTLASREEKGRFRREFTASLRLVSGSGEEINRLEFLTQKNGSDLAASPDALMNFWAQFKLPGDLQPGKYRLIIEARDVLGQRDAVSELEILIPQGKEGGARRAARAPRKDARAR